MFSRLQSQSTLLSDVGTLFIAGRSPLFLCLILVAVVIGGVFISPSALARSKSNGNGLSVEINHPVEQVLRIVREVVADGFIRGTSQYKDSAQLEGAVTANSSSVFKPWAQDGTVLYKVRPHTLSPDHFDESGDEGTVVVRYIVQSIGPNTTRLRIDAVFQESARRTIHPSDGTPENGEFLAIEAKIKDVEEKEAQSQREAGMARQVEQVEKLQATLDQESAELNTIKARQAEVQQQIQASQRNKAAHIRTLTADLKASPYNQSRTLQALSQGDTVTILRQTSNWCEVIAPNGDQGWIYRLMIEVIQ